MKFLVKTIMNFIKTKDKKFFNVETINFKTKIAII